MTQVSRIPLKQEVLDSIFDLFLETLINIKDKKRLSGFVQSIFTPNEKIMLAKRLAAALLLAKGHSYHSIRSILKLSPPTISKMNFRLKYEGEELNPVIEGILRRQAKGVVIEELKDFLDIPTKSTLKSPVRLKRKTQRKRKIEKIKSEF